MTRKRQCSAQTLALLTELLNRPRSWQHGYDLSKRTTLKSGTLYPILMRLCDRGVLESRWQPPQQEGRPPRHTYRLTCEGAAFAREQIRNAEAADLDAALKDSPA